ncbi:MAG: MBL fold metallo-hydrolase [Sandaracinaceae bacterium]|nr:MAG: MBL fold metallo-hydrolase [Sandaracinaceae bacterium]HBQ14939.1 MBL fold metallo-hydrolase [Myxococcales bacterium]
MRVHHLGCGTMCPRGGGWLDGRSGGLLSPAELVCHVLLVETDRHGLVLVDTGFGLDDCAAPRDRLGGVFPGLAAPVLDEAETARRQIEALGLDPADVRHVVLTHMDLDHAGGLSDFPDASVHLYVEEHRAATDPPTRAERQRYRACQWAHGVRFETYEATGEPWMGFACARDLRGLPPEILLVPLTGHSRGHSAVAVDTGATGAGRWLLHCGDAYFHEDELNVERPSCPGGLRFFQKLVAFDKTDMLQNQARLRALMGAHGDEVRAFSAHDAAELARMQAR